jgi:membrane-bound metal-dependent hydrolase YbcI (DUF457 family)
MMGKDHDRSGLAAGLAVGEFLMHLPLPGTLVLAWYTGAFATFNDLDQCGSCAARSLGFLSEGVAVIIRKLSGGHRHLTHSALGVAIFTGLAWAACHYRGDPYGRVSLAAFLALGLAAGFGALRIGGHYADVIAIAAAAAIAWTGYDLVLVPVACGLGMTVHIAGDMLTKEGCPVASPLTARHFRWWPPPLAFTTNTKPEALFGAAFMAATFVLIARGVLVALDPAAWASLMHAVSQTPHLI